MNITKIVKKAEHSGFYRFLLNQGLAFTIPFNRPHGFRIIKISHDQVTTFIPYRRRNLNHIKGLHACAMATLSEFTTGFLLIQRLDMKKYRIIMQKIEMEYHYQGKTSATATFKVTDQWMREKVEEPLKNQDAVVVNCEVKLYDKQQHHLTTGQVYWQIKPWDKVKTKR